MTQAAQNPCWVRIGVGILLAIALDACSGGSGTASSGGSTSPTTAGSGGVAGAAQGGAVGSGGSNVGGGGNAGGTVSVGGTTSTGGTTNAGGSRSTGGTTGIGGATATGGTASAGGSRASGGTTNAGGSGSTGGITSIGGSTPTGGTTSTSGRSTGDTTDTGGTISTGGNAGSATTGGTTGTGASSGTCQPATCGSHKWACWPMPNAAGSGLPNPASYTAVGTEAVLDNVTCLTWQKTEGSPAASTFSVAMPDTLANNIAYCAGLASSSYAGFSDWRVPTRVELASIVDYTKTTGEAVNATFAWAVGKGTYDRTFSLWYETIAGINNADLGWVYNLGTGTYPGGGGLVSNAYAETSIANVRCVRGNGAGETEMEQAVEPPNHYTVASGEVTDNYTGLIWQQDDSSANNGAQVAWSAAAGYCSSLTLNGHTWRVPSLNELATLVNEGKVQPAINTTVFPGTHPTSSDSGCKYQGQTTWYWASEPLATETTYGWGIDFCDGYTGANNATSGWNFYTTAWVKCVR